MRPRILALFAAAALPVLGQYTYYYSDAFSSLNTNNWTANGSVSVGGGLFTSSSAGSLISKIAVPDGTSSYEVKTTLSIPASGGSYVAYLRATSNALLTSTGATGTFWL